MRYRTMKILEPEDLGASGTKVIDIKTLDVLSRISLVFKATNAGTTLSDHPAANITKVELVDGSEVLLSLTGKQLAALNFYQCGRLPYSFISGVSGDVQVYQANINFGRYLWDSELCFDPKKFRNPQLRITFDEDASQADATVNECQVIGYAFDEVTPAPVGLIRAQEHYSYTLAASGKQYVDLPQDHLLREVYVRCEDYGTDLNTNLASLKLSEDRDKRVPMDLPFDVLAKSVSDFYGTCAEELKSSVADSAVSGYVGPSYDMIPSGIGADAAQGIKNVANGGGEVSLLGVTAATLVIASFSGICPFNVIPVVNLMEKDYDNWYDVTTLGSAQLIVEGASGATGDETVEILTEQLYRY